MKMTIEPQIVDVEHAGKPRRFVFVLMDKFTMLCFASAVECLRIANRTAGKQLYDWKIIGEGGDTITCSNGCGFQLQDDLVELDRDDTVMLCGGENVQQATTKRILNWTRREARRGATIAGLCTAGFTMRIGVRHPKLSKVIQIMETNIEEPISPAVLARDVGMSTRQLERLFRRYLSRSPKRYYMELRLQKARNLLMQTDMTVINVALACGFASPSHFSKCYRSHYDTTPYRERGTHATRLSI